MAESSLSIGKTEIDKFIANFLGYGRTSASWTTAQTADIDQARDAGVARFYGEKDWFFLSPPTTLTTVASDYDQDLPDDFGSFRETFYWPVDQGYSPIIQTSVGKIRELRTQTSSNGIMTHFALNPKTQTGASGTRWEVLWYPTPDAVYAMPYRYNVLRDALSATYPYPAGGMAVREAIVEACLAAADLLINDAVGAHEQMYQVHLQRAKQQDERTQPRTLGQNDDYSDDGGYTTGGSPVRYAKVNGVVPS